MNARILDTDTPPNLVDRAARSVDKLLDATRLSAESALDSVSDRVHSVRDRAAPALDRMSMPIDRLTSRTQDAPLQSLLVAAAAGAVLMALLGLMRSSR
jgi:ElaB/YqjD/DUF883 family membrane-anchored ribosome-binding protein